jgi:hypothetical protein
MPWKIVERRLGRAGGVKQRNARQRDWDKKFGEGNWCIGYLIDGDFISQEEALESVYYRSYEAHFANHPKDLEELLRTAKTINNPHAVATTGVDLQVPAILDFLKRNNLQLEGTEVVDIGSWQGQASHALSIRLSPLTIEAANAPNMTLEQFWQEKKCLAIWED